MSVSRTIGTSTKDRKRLFRMALASAGMSLRAWARREDLTHGHLSLVLSGKRAPGVELAAKMAAFIAAQLKGEKVA